MISNGVLKEHKKILNYCGTFRDDDICLPVKFNLDKQYIPDVRNQGAINSCVGFAITNIMQILNQVETGSRERFSAGYVYGKCRNENEEHKGMCITSALDYLIKTGSCFESDFPYNEEVPKIIEMVRNRPDLDEKAKPYHIAGYEVYEQSNKEEKYKHIKISLYQYNTPILTSTKWFGGNHAVCIIGWNDTTKRFTILNSYGEDWGEDGIGYVPYSQIDRGYLLLDAKNSELLMPFEDVSKDEWYYKTVQHVYNAGLMNGTSANTFEPNRPLTRAEMAQVLVNLCKKIDETKGD